MVQAYFKIVVHLFLKILVHHCFNIKKHHFFPKNRTFFGGVPAAAHLSSTFSSSYMVWWGGRLLYGGGAGVCMVGRQAYGSHDVHGRPHNNDRPQYNGRFFIFQEIYGMLLFLCCWLFSVSIPLLSETNIRVVLS